VFFYLMFPWLVRAIDPMSAHGRRVLIAAVVGVLLLYPGVFSLTVAPHDFSGWEWTTYVAPLWRLGEFVVGIVAALAVRDGWRPQMRGWHALVVACVLAGGLLADGLVHGGLRNRPLVEVAGMLVVALVIVCIAGDELNGRRRVLASRPMVALGAASYALYLCHALLYGWLVSHWSWTGNGMMRVVGWSAYVALAVALAFALHHLVEVPSERWLRHRRWKAIGRRPPTAPAYPEEPARELEPTR